MQSISIVSIPVQTLRNLDGKHLILPPPHPLGHIAAMAEVLVLSTGLKPVLAGKPWYRLVLLDMANMSANCRNS